MQLPKPMRRYMSIQGPMIAAGLAYFAFMSLIPLVMIAIAAAAFIYGGGVEKERIVRALGQLLPSGVTTARDIVDVLVQNRGKIGIAATVMLVWTATTIVVTIQRAFAIIFKTPKDRHFIWVRLISVLCVSALAAALAFMGVVTPFIGVAHDWYTNRFGQSLFTSPWVVDAVSRAVTAVFAVIVFTMVYKILPDKAIRWRNAVTAGAVFGLLWELARTLFGTYVAYTSQNARVYGQIWNVMVLMIWFYVAFSVLLFGAVMLHKMEGGDLDNDDRSWRTT